jgi:hypothetical protein
MVCVILLIQTDCIYHDAIRRISKTYGKAGLSIKEFATLLDMNPNSITNYKKIGKVPTHIAVLVYLLSSMKDEGVDFYPIFEKIKSYSKD